MNKQSEHRSAASRNGDTPGLSVIVPAYNEAAGIDKLLTELGKVLDTLPMTHEVIVVDDGSDDDTAKAVLAFREKAAAVKLVQLSRNFGKEAALNAGHAMATGKAVIQIDADLQHPPELIPDFVEHWQKGIDIVYGVRLSREHESLVLRLLKKAFYRIFSMLSEVRLMEGLGDFLLMDRKVVNAMLSLPERERFSKGLYAWVGFSRKGIPFEVSPRAEGASSWTVGKLMRLGTGAIVSFGTIPLRVWSLVGLVLSVPALLYGLWFIFKTIVFGIDVPGYPSLIVALCFFSGIQLLGLGIFGEYLARVLKEVRGRPTYIIDSAVGFPEVKTCTCGAASRTDRVSAS